MLREGCGILQVGVRRSESKDRSSCEHEVARFQDHLPEMGHDLWLGRHGEELVDDVNSQCLCGDVDVVPCDGVCRPCHRLRGQSNAASGKA